MATQLDWSKFTPMLESRVSARWWSAWAGVIQAIFDQMKHAYIGETPFDTERVVAKIMSAGWYSFERTAGLVIGGLDMACWDALGKFLKPPIYKLMGGAVRTEFSSMYFVPADQDIGVMTERAVAAVGRGFNTIYYKVGIDEERDVELVLPARESIGPGPVEPFDGYPHPLKNAACFP